MDFLLECIGFPPDMDPAALAALVRAEGEPVAWRGPGGEHLRLPLADGLELRLDREDDQEHVTLLPHYAETSRLRVAVESAARVPDSPHDALLVGWAAPPVPGEERAPAPGAYRLATWITDARRLPRRLPSGHVLAVSVAGFALTLDYVGPNNGGADPSVLERRRGFACAPLGGDDDPGGCADVSARVRAVRHLRNARTHAPVDVLEVDAPERPLHLFVSPWQLEQDDLPAPRPGYRVEGTFLFTGRVAGGLPRPARTRKHFG
ncbi:MAG: hypothetical protein H6828_01430 [Planctomycetes bacterium]|nr:hypothetical protein [Planctomycetota bacterium]